MKDEPRQAQQDFANDLVKTWAESGDAHSVPATSERPDRASGVCGPADLEMTKRCAQSLGLYQYVAVEPRRGILTPTGVWVGRHNVGDHGIFDPLFWDNHAMQLLKHHTELAVQHTNDRYALWVVRHFPTGTIARHKSLNRAIVECVAQLPRATPLSVGQDAGSVPEPNTPNAAVREALAELVRLEDEPRRQVSQGEAAIIEGEWRAAWSAARALIGETK